MTRRRYSKDRRRAARLLALAALALGAVVLALRVLAALTAFPRGLTVLACVAVPQFAMLFGLSHRGVVGVLGLVVAVGLAGGASVWLLVGRDDVLAILPAVGLLLTLTAASGAFRVRVALPLAPRPERPVLFYNPRSGGGKAERFRACRRGEGARDRAGRACARRGPGGARRDTVSHGPTRSPWRVAAGLRRSRRRSSPSTRCHARACPAGTRNHFALDLGVDRDDVVSALDALVDGTERIVDLAEVNGRVFVNNVSLGVYGEAVQRPQYRNAKLRTLLATVPDAVAPDRQKNRCAGPIRRASSSRVRRVACRSWSRTSATGWATLRSRESRRTWRRGCAASSLPAGCRLANWRRVSQIVPVCTVEISPSGGEVRERARPCRRCAVGRASSRGEDVPIDAFEQARYTWASRRRREVSCPRLPLPSAASDARCHHGGYSCSRVSAGCSSR